MKGVTKLVKLKIFVLISTIKSVEWLSIDAVHVGIYVNSVDWNDGMDYWSATPTVLHNLSMYSCMEVTVKLSLCTSDHCVFYGHILKQYN